jgi:murein L,D-transpeptidase YcbB/YkuD
MTSNEIVAEFSKIAREGNLDPAALLAVAELETGLRAHATVDGRREPLIRFEGHYFDRRLSEADRGRAREAGLSSPRAGGVANPASQAARWKLLERAAAIDRKAAYESVSWGLGQVMGAHWAWLGYASVEALVTEARSGVAGQARLMATFIDKAGLAGALRSRDWAAFARGYNGPAYHRNAYDTRLAAAYARHKARLGRPNPPDGLARGARGEAVRELQSDLVRNGFTLVVDGMFGPATESALRAFQQANGIEPTGIACAATREAMAGAARPRTSALLGRLFGWLGLPRLSGRRRMTG